MLRNERKMFYKSISKLICVNLLCLGLLSGTSLCLHFKTEYDYIIVGSGSAGATLASRLSEDKSLQILLLEAGHDPPPESEIPFIPSALQHTEADWEYFTEPQSKAFWGIEDRRNFWPRGKVVGGTSILNYMVYVRGNRRDFDQWEKQGCKGWSYKDVLPYFIKSEDCLIPDIANNGFHGTGGPQTVTWPKHKTELGDAFFESMRQMGYEEVDYNGQNQTGYANTQFVIRDGKRCSTEKAFLRQAYERPNFHLIKDALVTKIEFDKKNRAKNVVFEHKNNTYKVDANKEIIISAGTINSPQLLMLSGIGPKKHLEEFGIPVVMDLPGVGQNLHDHVGCNGAAFRIKKPVGFADALRNPDKYKQEFDEKSSGPLTVTAGMEAIGFVNTKFADKSNNFPDIEIALAFLPFIIPGFNLKFKNIEDNFKEGYGFTMIPILQRPKSRGFIKLKSANPHDYPIIDPQYLTVEEDVDVLADGLRIMKKIADSKAFQELGAEAVFNSTMPICNEFESWSEDFRKCLARTLTITTYHTVGTCKMGDVKDKTTVVDPELRVKGVKGLRVADCSVIPSVVSANTHAACIMIGERAADFIKKSLNTL